MANESLSFIPQQNNSNRHTARGMGMLEKAIGQVGWLGAMTAAADGELFAGSARREVIETLLPGAPIVVHSDGTQPIYVVRDDIPTADHPTAIKAGILDNRVSEVNYEPIPDVLLEANDIGAIALDDWWTPVELEHLFTPDIAAAAEPDDDMGAPGDRDGEIDCVCPKCGEKFIRKL